MTTPNKSEGAEYTNCPECGNPTDNGHDRCLPPNPYVCSQCEAMSEGAEWEREVDRLMWKEFDKHKRVPYYRPDEVIAFIAQERQQAVAEFAREVVARVERMNGEPGDMGIHGGRDRLISKAAVLSILKQRGVEPGQPINSIFKE